jgi:ferric-dicitrate binding protein FerR (iron transport regulator)
MSAWFRRVFVAAVTLALPAAAAAQMVIESLEGSPLANGGPVWRGYPVAAGSTLTTGRGAQAVLRLESGSRVALDENSELRIGGSANRLALDLSRGAARVVAADGVAGGALELRTAHASFAPRSSSADFTVTLVNPAYLSVAQGAVSVTNAAGTVVLGAGTTASVANAATLAAAIPASSLPPVASASVGKLAAAGNMSLAAGGAASGAAPAAGGVAAGVGLGNVAIGVAAAAVAAAAGGGSGGSSSATTHH